MNGLKLSVILLFAAAPLCAAAKKEASVAQVNGKPIAKAAVEKRLWSQFGDQVIQGIINEQLITDEAEKTGVKADEAEFKKRYDNLAAQYTSTADFQAALKSRNVTDEEVKGQLKLRLVIEALVVKEKSISVSEEEVKKVFEDNKDKFGTPAGVKLRQILLKTKQEADDMLLALKAGADFAALASQKSVDTVSAAKGGDIGPVYKGQLLPDIEKTVFDLKTGQLSDPISAGGVYHILKVDTVIAAVPPDYEKVKNQLREGILQAKIDEALPQLLNDLRAQAKIEVTPQ